jgi:hypothetical protein
MPNRVKIEITEEGTKLALRDQSHPVVRVMPLETARVFLYRKAEVLRLAASRAAWMVVKVIAHEDGIFQHDGESPDAVDRLLIELKGQDILKGRRGEDTSFNAPCNRLARAMSDVQRQQDWIYNRPPRPEVCAHVFLCHDQQQCDGQCRLTHQCKFCTRSRFEVEKEAA